MRKSACRREIESCSMTTLLAPERPTLGEEGAVRGFHLGQWVGHGDGNGQVTRGGELGQHAVGGQTSGVHGASRRDTFLLDGLVIDGGVDALGGNPQVQCELDVTRPERIDESVDLATAGCFLDILGDIVDE